MDSDREQRIRERAYEIWEREGRAGSPEDHWFQAEREVTAGDASSVGPADLTQPTTQAQGAAESGGNDKR